MRRYLVFLWNPSDHESTARVQRVAHRLGAEPPWALVYQHPGVLVGHASSDSAVPGVHSLAHAQGVILGSLYRRTPDAHSTAVGDLDEASTRGIVTSAGRDLIERYWGAYVALIRDARSGQCSLLREPTASLACFHFMWDGIHVIFSEFADLVRYIAPPLTVDRSYLATRLALGFQPSRRCALTEVEDIPGGEWTTFAGRRPVRTTLWHPDRFCIERPLEDESQAAAALRATVLDTVQALTAAHDRILLQLSGGLDSSIVAACIARQTHRPQVQGLNFFMPASDAAPYPLPLPVGLAPEDRAKLLRLASSGDEREFARIVARRCGFPLTEYEKRLLDLRDPRIGNAPLAPVPSAYVFSYEDDAAECESAAQTGATACFSGHGGDTVFYATQRPVGAVDYAFLHPLRAGLGPHILWAATLSGESIVSVLRKVFRHGLLHAPLPQPIDPMRQPHLLRDDVFHGVSTSDPPHPWLDPAVSLCSGKRIHSLGVALSIPFYYNTYRREILAPAVHPLAAQPVVELALRIPTYVLLANGISRGLARRAFHDLLPAEITRRTVKGTSAQYWQHVVRHNVPVLRQWLLDGELVRHGLLDRSRLEHYLTPDQPFLTVPPTRIMDYLACETWLHQVRPR